MLLIKCMGERVYIFKVLHVFNIIILCRLCEIVCEHFTKLMTIFFFTGSTINDSQSVSIVMKVWGTLRTSLTLFLVLRKIPAPVLCRIAEIIRNIRIDNSYPSS